MVNDLLGRSTKATCGIMEREIIIRNEKVAETKRKLRAKGFIIIGTSELNGLTRKIWFIRAGGF